MTTYSFTNKTSPAFLSLVSKVIKEAFPIQGTQLEVPKMGTLYLEQPEKNVKTIIKKQDLMNIDEKIAETLPEKMYFV